MKLIWTAEISFSTEFGKGRVDFTHEEKIENTWTLEQIAENIKNTLKKIEYQDNIFNLKEIKIVE